jgi:hypothetical protein
MLMCQGVQNNLNLVHMLLGNGGGGVRIILQLQSPVVNLVLSCINTVQGEVQK